MIVLVGLRTIRNLILSQLLHYSGAVVRDGDMIYHYLVEKFH